MRIKLTQLAVVVAAVAGVSTSAFAIDPQSIRVSDGLMFTPTVKLEQRHDDNLFATRDNRKSTWATVIDPSFALSLDRAKSAYELKYRMSSKNFHSSNSNSYIDHHFTAKSGFEFNSRNRLLLDAGYHKLEDTASDVESLTSRRKNDKWNTKNVGGVYTYGARSARTQVDLGLNYRELRYDNSARNSEGVRVNSNSERDTTGGRITGYYAIGPKTKLLLEGRYTDYDYINDSSRDNKNKALLAGVTWEATAKTSGTVKIGREKKSYKESGRSSKSTGMWEAGVTWAPRTYSTFNLKTRRGYDEGNSYLYNNDPDFDGLDPIDNVTQTIKTVDSQLTWRHYWMDRLYSTAQYRRLDRKYQGQDRDDKIDQYGVGLTYQMRRWLDIGIGYTHRENDSDIRSQSYKRNIYAVTFNASL